MSARQDDQEPSNLDDTDDHWSSIADSARWLRSPPWRCWRTTGAARERARTPRYRRSDNGPEFVARAILRWLQTAQIETAFIDPGKPSQNGANESFNGKFRDQHLSLQWFRNRTEAHVSIEAWRRHYNEVRPHSSLRYLTPAAFKAKHLADVDQGRSPALPARAEMTTNEEPLTGPTSAVLH